MQRFTDLDTVLSRVWERLETAASQSGHPFQVLPFGTVEDGEPHLRTVVLRQASADERLLAFHSDRRSQKIDDLRVNDRIAWLAWDPETSEQVRLRGRATVHLDDAVADQMWDAESPRSLDVYVRETASGTPLEAPAEGLDGAVTTEPVTREDVAKGRPFFAVVRTVIDEIDWLHLHPEGHYRAQFHFDEDTQSFSGTWVVP